MCKVVIIGGGWSGCAAAIRACKGGAETVILEKTDMLLGLGNVGGIMRNNGRFTATEENICLGADELFNITDKFSLHKNVNFPGHDHASFYDVTKVEPEVRRYLKKIGVQVRFMSRATNVEVQRPGKVKGIEYIRMPGSFSDVEICQEKGDVFIETTGTSGPMGNCMRYGNGCAMCILRCPTFGPRVSLSEKAGNPDYFGERNDGKPGAFSGSCKLEKNSLSKALQKELNKKGFVVIPLPAELIHKEKLSQKVCKQYALDEYAENIILIDTGYAKLMTSFFNLEQLRKIEGFENVRIADPYGGGKGNSIRYMAVGERDMYMKALALDNLFLAGEKSGLFVGHTEAITTGSLAGYNAVCSGYGRSMLSLPERLAVGRLIEMGNKILEEKDGFKRRLTFAGGEFFDHMKETGLYITDTALIRKRVKAEGLLNVYKDCCNVVE